MQLSGRKATVVGLGETGLSVVRFLKTHGAVVRVNDRRDVESLGDAVREAESLGAEIVLGGHPSHVFDDADVVIVSPGVPAIPALERASQRGVEVIGEVELASRFIEAPIVAVTGTNGKSTVTTLIGEMCKRLDRPVFVGGNLGRPMIEAVDSDAGSNRGLVVVELSSFQLERVERLKVHLAVLLNITPDHLDRYDSFEAYAAAKARIFERQTAEDYALIPADEPDLRELVHGGGKVVLFDGRSGEVRVEKDALVDTDTGLEVPLCELRLKGSHNLSNASAAALAARLLGVDKDDIARVLRGFEGLAHRMQHVGTIDDVEFIDDSKATNVGAAVAAVEGLAHAGGKVVLIAGGVHKGGSYAPLRERMESMGRGLVLIGEATPLIESAFEGSTLAIRRAESLEDAVARAAHLAHAKDTVLLAPACSSFDMFGSYAERGEAFRRAVSALGGTP